MPEEPTPENIKAVLNCLLPVKKYELATTNQAEIDAQRGQPGEPIPIQEHRIYWTLQWVDRLFKQDEPGKVQIYKADLGKVERFALSVLITAEQNGSEKGWP